MKSRFTAALGILAATALVLLCLETGRHGGREGRSDEREGQAFGPREDNIGTTGRRDDPRAAEDEEEPRRASNDHGVRVSVWRSGFPDDMEGVAREMLRDSHVRTFGGSVAAVVCKVLECDVQRGFGIFKVECVEGDAGVYMEPGVTYEAYVNNERIKEFYGVDAVSRDVAVGQVRHMIVQWGLFRRSILLVGQAR